MNPSLVRDENESVDDFAVSFVGSEGVNARPQPYK